METDKKKEQGQRATQTYGALERCEAILSVWSERRKPNMLCKEMGIPWSLLNQWQDRALEAMLVALEPRKQTQSGPNLNGRLRKLLDRHAKIRAREKLKPNLEKRLTQIQTDKGQEKIKTT